MYVCVYDAAVIWIERRASGLLSMLVLLEQERPMLTNFPTNRAVYWVQVPSLIFGETHDIPKIFVGNSTPVSQLAPL